MEAILEALEQCIIERKSGDPSESYVASLFAKGTSKIAQKVGEEGVEVALALVSGDKEELTKEAADLLFHLMIALEEADLSLHDVTNELARRDGLSGLEEKRNRS